MAEQGLIVLTTCPDADTADRIAEAVVAERLAACVNRLGGIESVYRWDDRPQRNREWLLLVKTTSSAYPALERRIRQLHPYDVPEVVAVPLAAGSAAYLAWLCEGVCAPPGGGSET